MIGIILGMKCSTCGADFPHRRKFGSVVRTPRGKRPFRGLVGYKRQRANLGSFPNREAAQAHVDEFVELLMADEPGCCGACYALKVRADAIARARKSREADRPRTRLATRLWKAANPERHARHVFGTAARRAARIAEQSDGTAGRAVAKIMAKAKTCLYCGKRFHSRDDIRIDHMHPVAHGGLHSAANLAASCSVCNTAKADSPLFEFVQALPLSRANVVRWYYWSLTGSPLEQMPLGVVFASRPTASSFSKSEQAARAAWHEWIHERAPNWWLDGYYLATGKPWNDHRLTKSERRKVRYQYDQKYREYHIYNKPSRSKRRRRQRGLVVQAAVN